MPTRRDLSERPQLPCSGAVPDYTNAFLVTAGVLCF